MFFPYKFFNFSIRSIHILIFLCGLISNSFGQSTINKEFEIDFLKTKGKFRSLHGVNNGPYNLGGLVDISEYHQQIKLPNIRLHDCNYPARNVVDISAVFPDFTKDPAKPESYNFTLSDEYIQGVVNVSPQIIYRLGESIDWYKNKLFNKKPTDYEKWASISLGIIKHYNEGWANGFHHNIQYWEIWNEPDLMPNQNSPTWSGSQQEYFELYALVSKKIKQKYPLLKVGGPASSSVTEGFFVEFLDYCKKNTLPLDFCSWHIYSSSPEEVFTTIVKARSWLNDRGFNKTLNVLDEWNYIPPNMVWQKDLMDPKNPLARKTTNERITGSEGAAFDAAVLIMFQDAPIDMANFYIADNMNLFSLFDTYGAPHKNFEAFKAIGLFTDFSNLISVKGNDLVNGSMLLAGMDEEKKALKLLVSNYNNPQENIVINLKNLPLQFKKYKIDFLSNDVNYDSKNQIISQDRITLKLKKLSFCLIEISAE